jgi:hypothetical protein
MTFLNPLLLLGLAAAAVPILLHLLSLRKLPTVPFSSLRFIRELQKTKLRRVRLTQWLLLALRTLLIIALVMAFARPALRGTILGTVGTHARTSTVLLVDDSPSMGLRNDRGELLARARSVAGDIASLMEEGDDLVLLPLSAARSGEPPPAFRTPDAALAAVRTLTVSPLSPPLREGLGRAASSIAESRNFNREVHVITDLQATQVLRPDPDSTDLFEDGVRVFLHDVGATRFTNAGITNVKIRSRILTPGRPVLLEAEVRNAGPAPLRNLLLSTYLGGSRVSQQAVDIPAGGTVTTPVSVIPRGRGFIEGRLEIEEDPLDIDNRRSFVLPVPGDVRVLLAAPTPAAARVPELALSARPDTGAARAFTHETRTGDALPSLDPGGTDVMILAGPRAVPAADADRIAQFVKSGGGLIFFPGPDTDPSVYTSGLFGALGLPPAGAPPPAGSDAVGFERVDFGHPLFEGLFDLPPGTAAPTVESPRVQRSLLPQPGERGQSIITLTNGVSFLTEYTAGEGRVLVFAVEAGLGWSDFPLRGIFVPLLHRSIMYLAARGQPVPAVPVGDPVRMTVRLPDRRPDDTFLFVAPDGSEERFVPGIQPGTASALVATPPTRVPGVYSVVRTRGEGGRNVLAAVPVHPEPAETDLQKADDAALGGFWTTAGLLPAQITRVGAGDQVRTTIQQSRFGTELWPHFLILALLCALAEMLLGRAPRSTQGAS